MYKFSKSVQKLKTKNAYAVFTAVLVIIFSTWAFSDATKAEVVLAADGDVHTVKTDTQTVGEFLEDEGIDVNEDDKLSHAKDAVIVDGMEIKFDSANNITLTIDGETEEYRSAAMTVGQFFQEEDLDFSRYDDISHSSIAIMKDDMEIEVTTAVPVKLYDGKEKEKIWTTEKTVEDVLKQEEIDYDEDKDKIKPGLDKKIKKDMKIKVTHRETKEKDKEETIGFDVEKQNDNSLAKGKEKVIKEGQEGKVLKTYEIKLENGEEVDKEVIGEEVLKESVNKVIAVGTKSSTPAANNKASTSKPASSGKTMTMEATAYGPDCAGCSGVSATGMDLRGGGNVIAVDPNVIPLGSKVWVEGYGEAVAGDTGGAIKGNRIDVLYPSESSAHSWGRRTVEVKVLN